MKVNDYMYKDLINIFQLELKQSYYLISRDSVHILRTLNNRIQSVLSSINASENNSAETIEALKTLNDF